MSAITVALLTPDGRDASWQGDAVPTTCESCGWWPLVPVRITEEDTGEKRRAWWEPLTSDATAMGEHTVEVCRGRRDEREDAQCRARLHGRDGASTWHCHRDRGHPMTPPLPMPKPHDTERNLHYGEDIEPGHPMQWRDSAFGAITDAQARWLA